MHRSIPIRLTNIRLDALARASHRGEKVAVSSLALRLRSAGPIVAPGVYDHVSLSIADALGFDALFASGYWASASAYGLPDTGEAGLERFVATFGRFTARARTPIIADADTGFGSLAECARAAAAYQNAGIAAMQIEDQCFPKQCGHTGIARCVDAEIMEARIRSAKEGSGGGSMLLVARTDARAGEGLSAAIGRLARYHAAGADILLLEAPVAEAEIAMAAEQVPGPLMINAAHGGRTPMLAPDGYARLGVKVAIYPSGAGLAAAGAAEQFYHSLAAGDPTAGAEWKPFAEVSALMADAAETSRPGPPA